MNRLLVCCVLVATGTCCRADVMLSISPASQTVILGSHVSFDVDVSGLGGGTALGVYDVNLQFDPTLLSYTNITFGNQLDLFGLGDIQSVTPGASAVEVFELSLESVSDLNTFQQPAFRLATLVFDTVATGTNSPITLSINALGNAEGDSITADLKGGSVTISPPSAIPEPSAVALLATVLLLMIVTHRKYLYDGLRR